MYKQLLFYIIIISNFCAEIKCENITDFCFKNDSISCAQLQIYQKVRELLDEPVIDLLGGISLVKKSNRTEKTLMMQTLEKNVENASDSRTRQAAIENYLMRKTREVMFDRVVLWNPADILRSFSSAASNIFKLKSNNAAELGRGRGKKLVKFLIPYLVGLKLIMVAVSTLAFIGLAVVAKKAILVSLISLLVSGIIGLKKLVAAKQVSYGEVVVPVAGVEPAYGGPPEPPIPQHTAYSSYKLS